MVGKLATAVVITGALGAGAGFAWLGQNPGALRPQWSQPAPVYERSAYYSKCQRQFSEILAGRPKDASTAACECFDKTISAWSQADREAAELHLAQLAISNLVLRYPEEPGANARMPKSRHEMQVLAANQKREIEKRMAEMKAIADDMERGAAQIAKSPLVGNALARNRAQSLLRSCSII